MMYAALLNVEKGIPSVRMREESPELTLANICGGNGLKKLLDNFYR